MYLLFFAIGLYGGPLARLAQPGRARIAGAQPLTTGPCERPTSTAPSRPVHHTGIPNAAARSSTSRWGIPNLPGQGADAIATLGATARRKAEVAEVRLP